LTLFVQHSSALTAIDAASGEKRKGKPMAARIGRGHVVPAPEATA
jgi:hypothetical protein